MWRFWIIFNQVFDKESKSSLSQQKYYKYVEYDIMIEIII